MQFTLVEVAAQHAVFTQPGKALNWIVKSNIGETLRVFQ